MTFTNASIICYSDSTQNNVESYFEMSILPNFIEPVSVCGYDKCKSQR